MRCSLGLASHGRLLPCDDDDDDTCIMMKCLSVRSLLTLPS